VENSPINILIPALGPASTDGLLSIANALLDRYGGEGTVLSVVEVPAERSLSEGALIVRRRRALLRKLSLLDGREFRAEVRTSHSLENGIRSAAVDTQADLLLLPWKPARRKASGEATERLVADPPCDIGAVKVGVSKEIRTVLVPARGGPHARLALRLAEALAANHDAVLTLFHVVLPHWDERRRQREARFFEAVRRHVDYDHVANLETEADSVEAALVREGSRHDVVVMGSTGRDERSSYLFGKIPETVAHGLDSTVIIVKTREPVTAQTFGLATEPRAAAAYDDISELVDRWFAENTFHSHEFRNVRYLVDLKERQGKTISLALPTLNEEKTIGAIISTIKRQLADRYPLIDELVVIDSNSEDRTVEIAESLGVPVYKHPEILSDHGSYAGKGEGLWKSLFVTSGDIVVWIDSDITDIHPKFVYGLVGPLLTQPRIGFVKGFYRRPLNLGGQLLTTGGGRVTELTARPLINLFYPQLSGLVQPLAGEMAGRRDVLEMLPMFTGYGVETGLLIDILDQFGLASIAQTDLETRVHRNQTLLSLSKMAFAIVQVVMKRLEDRQRIQLLEELSTSMKLIHYSPAELFLEVKEIEEHQRPPIHSLPDYAARFAGAVDLVPDPV
jgi:nucleotide-binding universal stress UspA family protein